jgi:hypothetical protein
MVSRCLSADGVRFWGRPVPAGGSASLTIGPLPYPAASNGVATFRTVEKRPVRVPSIPSRGSVSQEEPWLFPSAGYQGPAFPLIRSASQSLSPTTARPHRGFTRVHPSGLPLARLSRAIGIALGVHPRLGPRRYQRCPEGVGTGLDTGLEVQHLTRPCDFVSHLIRAVMLAIGCLLHRRGSSLHSLTRLRAHPVSHVRFRAEGAHGSEAVIGSKCASKTSISSQ